MENIYFEPGHIVRYAKKVGTIISADSEKDFVFEAIDGETHKIYRYEAFEIDLSDEQFRNMGFDILEDTIPFKCPTLKMFTVLKLNTDEFDLEKYDCFFPRISEGVISYKEGVEFKYSLLNYRGKTVHCTTPIKTITDLQSALKDNGCQIEFNKEILLKIEESMRN